MTKLLPLPSEPSRLDVWLAANGYGPDGGADPFAALDAPNPAIELPPAPAVAAAYTLRVDIVGAKPPIWRRLVVRSDITLDVLHRVLQAAFGWEGYHLHRFATGDPYVSPYFTTPADAEEGESGTPEAEARLDQALTEVGARLTYEYDFGDGWTHRLLLEAVEPWPETEPRTAWCLAGRRAGPLEDSGGIWRYGELAAWVRSGFAPDVAPDDAGDLAAWIPEGFDPDHFSVPETDEAIAAVFLGDAATIAASLGAHPDLVELLAPLPPAASGLVARWLLAASLESVEGFDAEVAAAVTRPWRVLLRHVGDGVTLSKAGYLPPAVVQVVYDELELGRQWIGKGNREDLTPPVLQLREQVVALGLLRKAKGTLSPTATARRLADDPVALLEHVIGRLPLGRRDDEQQAGWLMLLATAAGEGEWAAKDHVAGLLSCLGWHSGPGYGLDARAAAYSARATTGVLRCAGGDVVFRQSQKPAPRAVLLARLALVAR